MTPLYGFDNMNNSFLVPDYPYGRKFRCQIRYWLEKDNKKGFRFVSQTENPRSLQWNNPKKSTYQLIAGNMFLDENEHTHWSGLSEYSSAEQVLEFLKKFPKTDISVLDVWCRQKIVFANARLAEKVVFTINNQVKPDTEEEKSRIVQEKQIWEECDNLVKEITLNKIEF